MKPGQVFKADDGTEIRIESIDQTWYPDGDTEDMPRATITVTYKDVLAK